MGFGLGQTRPVDADLESGGGPQERDVFERLARAVRATSYTHRAERLAASGDFIGAMKLLDMIGDLYKTKFPSREMPLTTTLIYARFCSDVDRVFSFDLIQFVLRELNVDQNSSTWKYNEYEKDYLRYYCKLLLVNLTEYADSEAFSLAQSVSVTYPSLRSAKVRAIIRHRFPMNCATGIQLDQYLVDNL